MTSRKKVQSRKVPRILDSESNLTSGSEKFHSSSVRPDDETAAGGTETASENLKSNSRSKSTGPRTPQGKMRASRNAAKHRIFSKTLIPDEGTRAKRMGVGYMQYFGLQGAPEIEIGADIVQNRLEKHRIDKYALAELTRAPLRYQMEKLSALSNEQTQDVSSPRRVPSWSVMLSLQIWQRLVEMRGPRLDEDAKFIDAVYSGREEQKEIILFIYKKMALPQQEGGEKSAKLGREEYQAHILKLIESEIKRLELLMETDNDFDRAEFDFTTVALPPDDTLERIARYRTANQREFRRILEDLEMVRQLRHTS